MFTFYESDWFTITFEILFLLFIVYDTKRYFQTGKREYLLNIVLAVLFFFWALVPFYNKYFTWQESDRRSLIMQCEKEHNSSYCSCLEDKIFKEYDLESYKALSSNKDKELTEFLDECSKECRGEESWF